MALGGVFVLGPTTTFLAAGSGRCNGPLGRPAFRLFPLACLLVLAQVSFDLRDGGRAEVLHACPVIAQDIAETMRAKLKGENKRMIVGETADLCDSSIVDISRLACLGVALKLD
jgi:hypothetical protein